MRFALGLRGEGLALLRGDEVGGAEAAGEFSFRPRRPVRNVDNVNGPAYAVGHGENSDEALGRAFLFEREDVELGTAKDARRQAQSTYP